MRKTLLAMLALVFVLGVSASAQNLVFNGDYEFEEHSAGWSIIGGCNVYPSEYMSVPAHDGYFAGIVNGWGGNWNGPLGTIQQTVWGVSAGQYDLSFDYYIAARSTDAWRTAGIKVKVNGTEVFSEINNAEVKWSGDFPWKNVVVPVNLAAGNAVIDIEYHVHFAEWTWLATDNVSLTEAVPEPGSILALVSGLAGFGGMMIRRRK